MTNKILAGVGVCILAAGSLLISLLSSDEMLAPDTVVWFAGSCDDVDCAQKMQIKDKCACYITEPTEEIDGAFDTEDAESSQLYRFMWCGDKTRWRRKDKIDLVDSECIVIVDNLPIDVSTGFDEKLEEELGNICAPCIVTSRRWGLCPACAYNSKEYPGGCASVCSNGVE